MKEHLSRTHRIVGAREISGLDLIFREYLQYPKVIDDNIWQVISVKMFLTTGARGGKAQRRTEVFAVGRFAGK